MDSVTWEQQAFWRSFLAETGRPAGTPWADCYHFGGNEALANALLALVLAGRKRATTGALLSYEFEGLPIPEVGDLSLITDWAGRPACVTELTAVTILPFRSVTWEMARLEGEDENLSSWQKNHIEAITAYAAEENFVFTPDTPLVFQEFRVLYPAEEAHTKP